MSEKKFLKSSKWLKRTSKLRALSLFASNNVIHKYYHISFLDCLWRLNLTMFKRMKQIWLHKFNDLDPSKSKRFVWLLNTLICQNGCSKDHLLFIILKKKKKFQVPRPRPVFIECWAKPTWMGGVVLLPLKVEVRLVIFFPLD